MAKHKGSLLRQLTLGLGLAIIFLSLASFYYQYQVEKHIMVSHIRGEVARQAKLLRTWLMAAKAGPDRAKVATQYIETLEHMVEVKQELVVVDEKGKIIAANTGQAAGDALGGPAVAEALKPGASEEGVSTEVGGVYAIALPYYADTAQRKIAGAVLLRQPLTSVAKLVDSLMLGSFALLASTLVIIVIVVHVVLRMKVHKPMQAIFMQEYRIREGDLARIEAEDPGNEFSDLYAMYNEMVVRIAEQKKAILDQKDHVALAQLARQAITRLTGPLDEILDQSRTLLEHESSLSEADRTTLKAILGNITRIARELKGIVLEGNKSANWLKRETDKVREYTDKPGEPDADGRHVIE